MKVIKQYNPKINPKRLDIIVKYLYFKSLTRNNSNFYKDIYRDMYLNIIRHRTKGVEPVDRRNRNQKSKKTLSDYESSAKDLLKSMQDNGFNRDYYIPIKKNGFPENGSHRWACALALGVKPYVRVVRGRGLSWGIKELGLSEQELDLVLYNAVRLSSENYCSILIYDKLINGIDEKEFLSIIKSYANKQNKNLDDLNIVKVKSFDIEKDSHILLDIYGINWADRKQSNILRKIKILKEKGFKKGYILLMSVNKPDVPFWSILDKAKKQLRNELEGIIKELHSTDYTTIHIPSSHEENILLCDTCNSYNSFEFLPYKSTRNLKSRMDNWLKELPKVLKKHNIQRDDICITGSSVLDALGVRESTDIDFIIRKKYRKRFGKGYKKLEYRYDIVSEGYHKFSGHKEYFSDDEIIGNPYLHFYYKGFKFIHPTLVMERKIKQRRKKDIYDVKLMKMNLLGKIVQINNKNKYVPNLRINI